MASEYFTIEGKAGKKLKKLKNRREEERKTLRYKKLIAETVKLMLLNDSQVLTKSDIKAISLKIYGSYNKLKHIRVYNQVTDELTKVDINSELQRILTDRNIRPIEKIVDLTQKGEEAAKNTSDYIQVAKFYKEIAGIEPKKGLIKATERRTIDYSKLDDLGNPQETVIRTVETQTPGEPLNQNDDSEKGEGKI